MCSRKSRATPAESKEVTVGIVWICLDRWSTTTRMALYPFESRSSLIMSMEITCQHQSGTLLGISFPAFCIGKVFVQLHAVGRIIICIWNLPTQPSSEGWRVPSRFPQIQHSFAL